MCLVPAASNGLASPSLYSLLSRSASAAEQGLVMGTNQSLAALARTVGPAIAGLLYARVSLPAPMSTAGAMLLLAGTWLAVRATQTEASAPIAA